jgi:hypothetical protein
MDYEHKLLDDSILDNLEEITSRAKISEESELELARLERMDLSARVEAAHESRLEKEMDRIETLKELKEQAIQLETDKKEEEKFLSKANPELVNAVRNIQFLEAQLAQKDLENKRLTALVSVLEIKVRDAEKN